MATWLEITQQMKDHYTLERETENSLLVEMTLSSGRTQYVSLLLEELPMAPGYPFVQMFSPFADLSEDKVDLHEALSKFTQIAGLGIQEKNLLGYVWSWPMHNIDPTDLHVVIRLLMNHADGQERLRVGDDKF